MTAGGGVICGGVGIGLASATAIGLAVHLGRHLASGDSELLGTAALVLNCHTGEVAALFPLLGALGEAI